ncbi:MAG: hypothetical protein WA553_01310, partial [Methylocella sp.]
MGICLPEVLNLSAVLFHRSGWTQEELAKKERQGRQFISRRIIFGRFLTFLENAPTGVNAEFPPKNLTERKFRSYWSRTDTYGGNERTRFQAVIALMREETKLVADRRPSIAQE